MEYSLLTPPFSISEFDKMDKVMAQEHFDWYISEIPNRIKLLGNLIENTSGTSEVDLDYSKESLISLWKWYLNNVEVISKSDKEYNDEILNANEMTRGLIRKEKIENEWMAIALDISIYFAECLIRNNESLRWGVILKPKSLSCVNKPVIIGFSNNMSLDATNILFVQTRKIIKGLRKEEALFKLFENWKNQI